MGFNEFWADLRNGKFTSYARTGGVVSFIGLILFGIFFLTSILGAIFCFFFAAVLCFIEIPWLTFCCSGPRTAAFAAFFKHPLLRSALYAVMTVVLCLIIFLGSGSLFFLFPTVFLAITCIFYLFAAFKKEHVEKGAQPGAPGMEKERPFNPEGAGYANVV